MKEKLESSIEMAIVDLTEAHVRLAIDILHEQMKYHESLEEFDECANLRDMQKELGHYILGYVDLTSRIKQILFYAFFEHGSLLVVHEDSDYIYEATYDLEGMNLTFIFDLTKTSKTYGN